MKAIGLQPSHTGEAGGGEIGEPMSHFIIEGGLFDNSARALINKGFTLTWTSFVKSEDGNSNNNEDNNGDEEKDKKSGKRVLYACPEFKECGQSARSKYGAALKCGIHDVAMPQAKSIKSLNP